MIVIHGLAEIANDTVLQGAVPNDLIGVCGNEDRRDRVPRADEMSLELDPGHSRHLDVSDQAVGFTEERRCQEISCRREGFDDVAQQGYEFSHGFAKGLIILDDRYQFTWHRGFQANSLTLTMAVLPSLLRPLCNVSEGSRQNNANPLSDGLCRRLSA
jgi:hypothetical protein